MTESISRTVLNEKITAGNDTDRQKDVSVQDDDQGTIQSDWEVEIPPAYKTLDELGAGMRAAREAQGLGVEQIAETLKFSPDIVRAMEDGSIVTLRSAVYARGFLRTYIELLKIPAGSCEDVLRSLAPVPAIPRQQYFRPDKSARPPRRSPVLGILASLLIAVAAVWSLWHFKVIDLLVSDTKPTQTVVPMQTYERGPLPGEADASTLSRGMQEPAQSPNLPDGAGSADSAGSPMKFLAPGIPDADREPLPALVTPNSPWATLQGNATLAGQAGLATPTPEELASINPNLPATMDTLPGEGKHDVTIIAESTCWIQVTIDSGRPVQRTMEPGDSVSVPFDTSLVLRLGNAGGVRVFYDGVEQMEHGRKGQVRTLVFPLKPEQ